MKVRLGYWLDKAQSALNKDWERCDEETGAECRGAKCPVGAHRAMGYIERAMADAAHAENLQRVLLAAVRIALQKHEPYPGYKTTMLRQALQKAPSGHKE